MKIDEDGKTVVSAEISKNGRRTVAVRSVVNKDVNPKTTSMHLRALAEATINELKGRQDSAS
jgi:hypothetical protein